MKTRLSMFVLLLFTFVFSANAQETNENGTKLTSGSGEVFKFENLTEEPQFPGGNEARVRYLMENIHYPKEAKEKHMQGTVYVTFVIEKDGSITNVKVLKGVCPSLDNEAVRVIKAMPRWSPGKAKGETVRVQYNMPIRFILGESVNDDSGKSAKQLRKEEKQRKKAEKKKRRKAPKASEVKPASKAIEQKPEEQTSVR